MKFNGTFQIIRILFCTDQIFLRLYFDPFRKQCSTDQAAVSSIVFPNETNRPFQSFFSFTFQETNRHRTVGLDNIKSTLVTWRGIKTKPKLPCVVYARFLLLIGVGPPFIIGGCDWHRCRHSVHNELSIGKQ